MKRRQFIALGGATGLLASTGISFGQENWPTRAVTVISAYPPGGTSDILARLAADILTREFGQQFVLENVAGAAGALAGGQLARSAPDGYTILVSGSAPLAANKVVQSNLAYDPEADFEPITVFAESPALITASMNAPAKTLPELIEFAKANPGMVNIGNPGAGTKGHICAAIIGQLAGVDINHVPYKGSPPLATDLLGGHIDYSADAPANYLAHIRDGKLQAIAVTSAERMSELPDVPTVAEQGFEGYEQTLWFGIVGPKGMPAEIISKINDALKTWSALPESQAQLVSLGVAPVLNTPEEMREVVAREIEAIRPLVEAGLVRPT